MDQRARNVGIAGVLLAASLLGMRLLREPAYRTGYARLVDPRGMPFRVLVFTPEPRPAAKLPAVIVAPPVNTPPEYGRALSLELLAEGYEVLTFDWRGWEAAENRQFAPSGTPEVLLSDTAAAIAYLRSLPGIDAERIALTGHSAGGTLAIEAATADPRIMAAAPIGMEADVTTTRPRNLLWAVGLYDEFRTLTRMRDCFWASATTAADINTTVGDFRRGTARRLGVSPTADHFTESQDRFLHREIVDWVNQAAGKPATHRYFWMQVRQWLLLVSWFSALLLVIWTLLGVVRALRAAWVARLVPALALAGIWGLTRLASWDLFLRKEVVELLLIAVLVVGYACRTRSGSVVAPTPAGAGRKVLRYAVLVWLSIFLTLVVNNLASYLLHPSYLLWIPIFAVQHLADFAYIYTLVTPHAVFFAPAPLPVLAPRLWVYVLPVAEVLAPGIVLGIAARLARRSSRAEVRVRSRVPVAASVILACLLAALGVVVVLRLQEGFLTADSALAAVRFLLRFAVLPIVLFVALQRLVRRYAGAN
jgi:hypothetical protein